MALKKIVGMKKEDFDALLKEKKDLFVRPARLIPTYKPGDEMALTSIFLSSLCLIKEFKDLFFSEIKLSKTGQIFAYTEVDIVLSKHERIRLDGLILLVKSGTIKDAVIFEMKNKGEELKKEQIENYAEFAKNMQVTKLVTVSNQFVSNPTQFPISVKTPKRVDLFHFSWSYILTIAHVLLFDNTTNIDDPDQIAIMKEVVAYLESGVSGVCGFTKMKPGWKEVVEKITSKTCIKSGDSCVIDTISSWQQEERDMALILSRNLGLFVKTISAKYTNLEQRIEADTKSLIDNKLLTSTLKIAGAVSDLQIKAFFECRVIEMGVKVNVPLDKTVKGKIGWLKRQFDRCQKNSKGKFAELINNIKIDVNIKRTKGVDRISLSELDEFYMTIKDKDINDFGIVLIMDFGKTFSSTVKFVETIEDMLIDFYEGVVEHLNNWEPSAPKIVKDDSDE